MDIDGKKISELATKLAISIGFMACVAILFMCIILCFGMVPLIYQRYIHRINGQHPQNWEDIEMGSMARERNQTTGTHSTYG